MFWSHSNLSSGPKKRQFGRLTQQAALNVGLVCLAAGAVCGKQALLHFSLFASGGTCVSPPVTSAMLTDLYLTSSGLKSLRVEWDGDAKASFTVTRTPGPINGGVITSTSTTNGSHGVLIDNFAAQIGTKYIYSVQQTDPPPTSPYACTPIASNPVSVNVTPAQSTVSDNQSVDARYDPRYALWTHLNHNFGTTTYRGGLYVGYNGDYSQVAHSYLKFALPALPAGQNLWPNVGSVNAYFLSSYAPANVSVGCQSVSPAWTGANITWTAPPATNGGVGQPFTVSYANGQPNIGWAHWSMGGDIPSAVSGGTYSSYLFSPSEPSTASDPISGAATGWAYFSKKEYAPGQPACVLYAYSN